MDRRYRNTSLHQFCSLEPLESEKRRDGEGRGGRLTGYNLSVNISDETIAVSESYCIYCKMWMTFLMLEDKDHEQSPFSFFLALLYMLVSITCKQRHNVKLTNYLLD